MGPCCLEDGEHDGEDHEGGDGAGEEEKGGLQDGPEAADFTFRLVGEDFLCLPEEAGEFAAFHAYPAEVVHQGEGEAASLQDIREILSPFQLVRHKGEGPLGIPISQHIPGVPEGFGEGASAFQEGGEGGAETDQKKAPVETGSVQQAVAHFPALF